MIFDLIQFERETLLYFGGYTYSRAVQFWFGPSVRLRSPLFFLKRRVRQLSEAWELKKSTKIVTLSEPKKNRFGRPSDLSSLACFVLRVNPISLRKAVDLEVS